MTVFSFDDKIKHIIEISLIERGVYFIKMKSKNGEEIDTTCRFSVFEKGKDETNMNYCNFNSDKFNEEIMKGYVDVKKLCNLIYISWLSS